LNDYRLLHQLKNLKIDRKSSFWYSDFNVNESFQHKRKAIHGLLTTENGSCSNIEGAIHSLPTANVPIRPSLIATLRGFFILHTKGNDIEPEHTERKQITKAVKITSSAGYFSR
jgi:hypothetical protein